jgi:hypothetical protein
MAALFTDTKAFKYNVHQFLGADVPRYPSNFSRRLADLLRRYGHVVLLIRA